MDVGGGAQGVCALCGLTWPRLWQSGVEQHRVQPYLFRLLEVAVGLDRINWQARYGLQAVFCSPLFQKDTNIQGHWQQAHKTTSQSNSYPQKGLRSPPTEPKLPIRPLDNPPRPRVFPRSTTDFLTKIRPSLHGFGPQHPDYVSISQPLTLRNSPCPHGRSKTRGLQVYAVLKHSKFEELHIGVCFAYRKKAYDVIIIWDNAKAYSIPTVARKNIKYKILK